MKNFKRKEDWSAWAKISFNTLIALGKSFAVSSVYMCVLPQNLLSEKRDVGADSFIDSVILGGSNKLAKI